MRAFSGPGWWRWSVHELPTTCSTSRCTKYYRTGYYTCMDPPAFASPRHTTPLASPSPRHHLSMERAVSVYSMVATYGPSHLNHWEKYLSIMYIFQYYLTRPALGCESPPRTSPAGPSSRILDYLGTALVPSNSTGENSRGDGVQSWYSSAGGRS